MNSPIQLLELREAATRASKQSYSPYSGYSVAAAVRTTAGQVYGGSNVEIVNYSLTKHAEEVAILAAIGDGALSLGRRWLDAIYVTAAPCGSCRQFLAEFAADGATVYIDKDGAADPQIIPFQTLLPDAFLPSELLSNDSKWA